MFLKAYQPVENEQQPKPKGYLAKLWDDTKRYAPKGLEKGAIIGALVAVAAIALFAGWMGGLGALWVGGAHLITIESGVASGISGALGFVTSLPGFLATAGVGSVIGATLEVRKKRREDKLQADHEQEIARIQKQAEDRVMEMQQYVGQQPQQQQQPQPQHNINYEQNITHNDVDITHQSVANNETNVYRQQMIPVPEAHRQTNRQESIYVDGSVAREKSFSAAELKRRLDNENQQLGKA